MKKAKLTNQGKKILKYVIFSIYKYIFRTTTSTESLQPSNSIHFQPHKPIMELFSALVSFNLFGEQQGDKGHHVRRDQNKRTETRRQHQREKGQLVCVRQWMQDVRVRHQQTEHQITRRQSSNKQKTKTKKQIHSISTQQIFYDVM